MIKSIITLIITIVFNTTFIQFTNNYLNTDIIQGFFDTSLQSWDMKEEDALRLVENELMEYHIAFYPEDDEYDPKENYTLVPIFDAFMNECDGAVRQWEIYAFYHHMPYCQYLYTINSITGEMKTPIYKDYPDIIPENEDYKVISQVLQNNEMISKLVNSDDYTYSIHLDKESPTAWFLYQRIIPCTISSDNMEKNIKLYIEIHIENGMRNREYFWKINAYFEKDYIENGILFKNKFFVPSFSNEPIIQVEIPVF